MRTKRFLSILLSLVLVLGLLPGMSLTASAEGNTTTITPSSTSGTMTITLKIKAAQTITASDVTATYGDTDKSVSASVTEPTTGGGAISYAVKTGSENYIDVDTSTGALTIKAVPQTDGKAYVIVTAAETDDYAETTKEVTVTISKATPVITLCDFPETYDGSPKKLISSVAYSGTEDLYLKMRCVTAQANDIEWTKYTGPSDLTNVFAPTNAGIYCVDYFVGTLEYLGEVGTFVGQTSIDKARPKSNNFTFTAPSSLNYDGTAKTATVTIKDGVTGMGEVTVKYYSDADRNNEVAECINPGTYYVGIDVDYGQNYTTEDRLYDWDDDSWKFTIASPHTHSFTYTADGATVTATCGAEGADGATVTATCGAEGCDLTSNPTLTIVAPTLTTYGQTGEGISEKATLDGLDAFNSATDLTVAASDIKYYGVEEYEIEGHTYKKQGDELAQVPTAAGEYVAGLTLSNVKTSETETGDVIARVWYTIAPASISSVTVTDITAPVATEALDTEAATSTANVTLGAVTWNPTTTPAAYATQYTATVIATAAANYAFADTATATVNGQAATVTKNDGGTLTIAYTFEKTALTPVTITATDKKADWSADGIAIPVEGMFTITEGAGAATYTVTNGTGEGTYDAQTGKLTVTKCGTFTVKVSTAATDTYAAGAETTATLTVNKVDSTAATVTANTLIYTGSAQALVTVTGEATGGTMQYALGDANGATQPYTTSIPTATDAGTYYVWYKVVGDENHSDTTPDSVTVTIQRRSSGGGSSTTTVTVPVTSDAAPGTVPVKASVSGTTATVTKLTDEQLAQVTTNKSGNKDADAETETNSVVIDVSGVAKDVKTATIPTETVKAVEETGSNLKVTLTDGSVEFDATAQAIITDEAKGTTIQVNLDAVKVTTLTSAQQSAVESLEVEVVLDAYVTSNGQRISDFKGGSATLSVPYTLKDGQAAQGIVVWYVASDGTRTQVPATYDGKNVVFTVPHFSNYVIAYDAEQAKVCPKDATCPIGKFSDASASAWYHDGVHWALENGVMNGVGNGKFAPNDTTTRAQVVTMLWRLEGSPAYVGMSEFSDVDNEEWYGPAIRWASAEGIVNGYDGKFAPNDPVTREQLVTILYRYAQYKKLDVSVGEDTNILSYDDAFDVSEWAIPAMQWACGSGIVNGIDKDGKLVLAPADSSTRAVVATMLWRFSK